MTVRVFPGRVEDGKIVVPDADVPLAEGTTVTVLVDSPDESFSLPREQEQQLLDAIEEVARSRP